MRHNASEVDVPLWAFLFLLVLAIPALVVVSVVGCWDACRRRLTGREPVTWR